MGPTSLQKITARIITTFRDVPVGQKLVHQTRVGIVTYNERAKIVGPLAKYTALDGMQTDLAYLAPAENDRVNIYDGLKTSIDMFNAVPKISTRQRLIILVASAYRLNEEDPKPLAKQFRDSGHKLMTIAVVNSSESTQELANISALATPSFSFRSDVGYAKFVSDIRSAMCRANCFCPIGWYQVTDRYYDPDPMFTFAECLKLSSDNRTWFDAADSCPTLTKGRAFLRSQLSQGIIGNDQVVVPNGFGYTGPVHIGLSFNATIANYMWEEKYTNCSRILLDPTYEPWVDTKENHPFGGYGVQIVTENIVGTHYRIFWKNVGIRGEAARYLCQQVACDTDVYCDDSVDDDL